MFNHTFKRQQLEQINSSGVNNDGLVPKRNISLSNGNNELNPNSTIQLVSYKEGETESIVKRSINNQILQSENRMIKDIKDDLKNPNIIDIVLDPITNEIDKELKTISDKKSCKYQCFRVLKYIVCISVLVLTFVFWHLPLIENYIFNLKNNGTNVTESENILKLEIETDIKKLMHDFINKYSMNNNSVSVQEFFKTFIHEAIMKNASYLFNTTTFTPIVSSSSPTLTLLDTTNSSTATP